MIIAIVVAWFAVIGTFIVATAGPKPKRLN